MFHAAKLLKDGLPDLLKDESEQIGAKLLGEAMERPIKTLVQNSGGNMSVLEAIEQSGDMFTGYDLRRMEMVDMMERGIYDSYSVIKVLLEDSVSLAGMVITTECILVK